MVDNFSRGDPLVNVGRQSPFRPSGSFKSTFSSRSTPKNSPVYRRLHSNQTPRREGRTTGGAVQWFRSSRIVYWLLLITLWAYLGFYVQSKWAHGDNKDDFLGFGGNTDDSVAAAEQKPKGDLIGNYSQVAVNNETLRIHIKDAKRVNVALAKKSNEVSFKGSGSQKKKNKRSGRRLHRNVRDKRKAEVDAAKADVEGVNEAGIPMKNASYGLLVGPFGSTEDKILEWSPEKRTGTCDWKGDFARFVWSRHFVLIFHELSMTGAPLLMLELATEFLSCGASISAVVLSKKGGLIQELSRRKIKVFEDRADLSFKAAMRADLVVAGSAVCASWIDQYISHFPPGGSQIVWWIMENRRKYFDQAKIVLNRVKMVVFLSETQTRQWLDWCEEESIKLRAPPGIIQLSVNDELAFVAGISCSLNTPSSSPEKMMERRRLLRDSVRKDMGLTDSDVLVMSLSSIKPGKGELLLVESAQLMLEQGSLRKTNTPVNIHAEQSMLAAKHRLRGLLEEFDNIGELQSRFGFSSGSSIPLDKPNKKGSLSPDLYQEAKNTDRSYKSRKLLSNAGAEKHALKLLIGSVGSKSNDVPYVKEILSFLSRNSNFSKSVLWTPATTRVASLYSAADVYIINSQGLGETFGRATIEAMAFGLPVLGTDAGGTKEIVEHNITGLLHPVGRPGTKILAQNLHLLLNNPSLREQMGKSGRKKVEKMYLKRHMYKKLAEVLSMSMRVK